MCYSNLVFTPFPPERQAQNTSDSYAVGSLSSKHNFEAGSLIEDNILPLCNHASALGHNFMITLATGNTSCGTIDLPMTSDEVRIVVARVMINTAEMHGNFHLVSI